jgi:transcriptional regulator with XRE-family HTH domain
MYVHIFLNSIFKRGFSYRKSCVFILLLQLKGIMEKPEILEFYKLVGRNIKNARREKDIKAFDIASQMDMSESAFTKMERGETKTNLDKIIELSQLLEKPIEYFFTDKTQEKSTFYNSQDSGKTVSNHNQINHEIITELTNQLKEKDKQLFTLLEILKK